MNRLVSWKNLKGKFTNHIVLRVYLDIDHCIACSMNSDLLTSFRQRSRVLNEVLQNDEEVCSFDSSSIA